MHRMKLIVVIGWIVVGSLHAYAQKQTEMYIPVGQSPGLSGKHTWVGHISLIDAQAKSMTLVTKEGNRVVKITGKTRIWLDRTKLNQPNQEGKLTDCQKGLVAEVKPASPDGKPEAEWVKLQMEKMP